MKRAIITPTYTGHFKYIKNYLKSFNLYMLDKDKIDFIFVIEKEAVLKFENIIKKFQKKLTLKIFLFEDILKIYNIKETPQELMNLYGRFTYQTFKKIYAMLHADYDQFLVLDSESLLIRPYYIDKLFNNFFNKPFISGTMLDITQRTNKDFNILKKNVDDILNFNCPYWLLENFIWFYDKKILKSLFDEYGNLIDLAKKIQNNNKPLDIHPDAKFGIFEICLYQNYLYKNREKLSYKFKNIDTTMLKEFGVTRRENFLNLFYKKYSGTCGILEHAMLLLTKENLPHLINIFKRLNINILRCDATNGKIYHLQKKFIKNVQPVILAASQEHAFCPFSPIKNLLKITIPYKQTEKLKKHLKKFLSPFFYVFQWLTEPFYIIKYLLKIFFSLLLNIINMLR